MWAKSGCLRVLKAGVQESKTSLGTVETVPTEEDLLDGGVTKAVCSAPLMKGLSLSFCPLTHSLVLESVVVLDEGIEVPAVEPLNFVDWVDWVLKEFTEEGALGTFLRVLGLGVP